MIKIDKNIPAPILNVNGGRQRLYPWLEMEIGDSFIFPKRFGYEAARVATQRYAPRKFVCRAEKDTDGFRIWRIA